jgi:hypothetical protein
MDYYETRHTPVIRKLERLIAERSSSSEQFERRKTQLDDNPY